MSTIVDNITLAIVSLKENLESYLDSNSWKNKYTMAIVGDPELEGKELVEKVTNSRKQIGLPLITIEVDSIRNEILELGSSPGLDFVSVSIVVRARDSNELRTISNVLRRKVTDYTFTVYNYYTHKKSSVGTVELTETILDDLSDFDSDVLADKHIALISSTMEITAQDMI